MPTTSTNSGSPGAPGAGGGRLARWGIILAGSVIVLAAWAAYANSFSAPFVFDDPMSIEQNPTIRHLDRLTDVLSPPATATGAAGRPVVNLSLALNYTLGGLDVRGYHVVNTLIHALAGLVLFGIVRRTLLRPRWRESFGAAALPLAFAIALLWVLHPLQTESVTCVVQRSESLMGLFYLLALLQKHNIRCELSLERYMKCGAGLCGSCVLDEKRVCVDGPVFSGEQAQRMIEFGKFRRNEAGQQIRL